MRVGVLGAGGRVGQVLCREILDQPDLELAVAVDPRLAGIDLGQVIGRPAGGLVVVGDLEACLRAGVDAVVDFSVAEAARPALVRLAEAAIPAVVGTTGFTPEDIEVIGRAYEASGAGCIIAANFSIGAVLLERCVRLVAPYVDSIEIVEAHHSAKRDAPSGTSRELARVAREAREAAEAGPLVADPTTHEVLAGARGALGPGDIRIHALRVEGAIAHHEVIFGLRGQTLAVRHDTLDRSSFVPGVLLALRRVGEVRGLVLGIDELL
ncbi:dihydrodipicolinate reductase [Acidimicrobium ferrooxidans DSM 10331]|uniref:4-hydroxy-tetrahydrodipicolinate reductase n=1 Tax=Acidimicrobium ferrooxidans (strain DSM 10331 / JCM 15462 / NBRC 103882 / ICP) TaxID=525909 RepID=C7LXZ1_ACIFD|nr:4-hydroxy-tetrahydrodipicolinate reductase [Acidimicrobium ferrooxidans]ACU53599.1 dihydrodipicolinate reductase [Acidimicrobium ferrooxidans DSM 10331]